MAADQADYFSLRELRNFPSIGMSLVTPQTTNSEAAVARRQPNGGFIPQRDGGIVQGYDGELRKFGEMMNLYGMKIEAKWMPSSVRRFVDSVSWTWDPGDIMSMDALITSLQEECRIDGVVLGYRPQEENAIAYQKQIQSKRESDWGKINPVYGLLQSIYFLWWYTRSNRNWETVVLVETHWKTRSWFVRFSNLI